MLVKTDSLIVSPVEPLAHQPWAEAERRGVFYVYVLRSLKNNKRYVGYTGKDPLQRLTEHNNGNTQWTRQNGPFALLHTEQFGNATEARKRELFLKSGKGRQVLDEMFRS